VTSWIVDASLAMTWYLVDEANRQYGLQVLSSLPAKEIHVPSLFVFELSNALVMAHRRNRIDLDALNEILDRVSALNIVFEPANAVSLARITSLAQRHGLTCYDAAYLDLGIRTGFPVATLNKVLLRAMQAENVSVVVP